MTLASVLPWPVCWSLQTWVPFSCILLPSYLLTMSFRKKGAGEGALREAEKDKTTVLGKQMCSLWKDMHRRSQFNPRVEKMGITPPWDQVVCLLEFYWLKWNSPWKQLEVYESAQCPVPDHTLCFQLTHSNPRSLVEWLPLSEKKAKQAICKRQPLPPTTIAFLLNATCKMYLAPCKFE